jgi:branched-chain amino acid transport system permease protein
VIMALGLNITLGYAGLLDIGFAVYYGAGAYTSAQFAIHFGTNFWLGLVFGGLSASFFGFLVAWPALRVHDHYLGLVTLGYGLVMNLLARNVYFLTNGTDGVINIPPPAVGSHEFTHPLNLGWMTLPFQANFYYLAVTLALLAAFVSYRLRQSKLGRAWDAIREDEIAARCSGVDARGVKILAFSTGAFFGGVGGAIYAHMIGFISPENFIFIESITIMVMVVMGGTGNIMGVAIGAVILVVLPERFREFEHLRLLFFGGALVLLMIYRPEGLSPRLRMRRTLHADKIVALLAHARDKLTDAPGVGAR